VAVEAPVELLEIVVVVDMAVVVEPMVLVAVQET
jgi:hypothetical protein